MFSTKMLIVLFQLNLGHQRAQANPPQAMFHSATIIEVTPFQNQGTLHYRLLADFGMILGLRETTLPKTDREDPRSLLGKKIAGVTELGRTGTVSPQSFFLVANQNQDGSLSVQRLDPETPNGTRLFACSKEREDEPTQKTKHNPCLCQ
jgi:hypothetical protein